MLLPVYRTLPKVVLYGIWNETVWRAVHLLCLKLDVNIVLKAVMNNRNDSLILDFLFCL